MDGGVKLREARRGLGTGVEASLMEESWTGYWGRGKLNGGELDWVLLAEQGCMRTHLGYVDWTMHFRSYRAYNTLSPV